MATVKPVFIFSLPRAGSTLLQRIIMSHRDVKSVAEPWVLLPLIYSMKREGIVSEYGHFGSSLAHEDFVGNLPKSQDDYREALSQFVLDLYSRQCVEGESYFLDKTPRYYLIIKEIAELFPDAKFIFLFRRFDSVFSSIIKTWGGGSFHNMHNNHIDLINGPNKLAEGYELLKSRALKLNYEDLVSSPREKVTEVCQYLGIKFDETMVSSFSDQKTRGRLGDKVGIHKYDGISKDSLDEIGEVFDSKIKKAILLRYLKSIDFKSYDVHGYSQDMLLTEARKLTVRKIGVNDLFCFVKYMLIVAFKLNLFFSKNMRWTSFKYLT